MVDHPESIAAAEPREDRHFVTALARGLDVLSAFRPGETWLANHEIAERCALPRSTVTRLTHTLTKLGYLHFVESVGKYRLGSRLMALGSVALGGLSVRQIARPAMRELANLSNATVGLGVRDHLSMRYVEIARGPAAIALNIDIGSRLSMVRSSMGRALIATLSPPERELLYHELRILDPLAWPGIEETLNQALDESARHGCSCSFGQWQENVSAIALGFHPGGGLPPMVINCGAPSVIVSPEFLLNVVRPRLQEVVAGLEGVMGA